MTISRQKQKRIIAVGAILMALWRIGAFLMLGMATQNYRSMSGTSTSTLVIINVALLLTVSFVASAYIWHRYIMAVSVADAWCNITAYAKNMQALSTAGAATKTKTLIVGCIGWIMMQFPMTAPIYKFWQGVVVVMLVAAALLSMVLLWAVGQTQSWMKANSSVKVPVMAFEDPRTKEIVVFYAKMADISHYYHDMIMF